MYLGRKLLDCINLKYLIENVFGSLGRMAKRHPEKVFKDQPWPGKWKRRQKGTCQGAKVSSSIGCTLPYVLELSRLSIPTEDGDSGAKKKKKKAEKPININTVSAANMNIRRQYSNSFFSNSFQ